MRTRTWITLLATTAATLAIGCGDDGTTSTSTGGQGTGGAGGNTVTTTTASGGASTGGSGGGETATFSDSCPGDTLTMSPGKSVTLNGTTAGATDDTQSFCADTTPAADNNDVVVAVNITAPCTLTVSLDDGGHFNGAISERRGTCDMRSNGDSCSNGSPSGTPETYKEAVTPGMIYFVVDSADGNSGDFSFSLSCQTGTCGDGVVNPGEECDGGGVNPNDGCGDPGSGNSACKVEGAIAAGTCADISGTVDVTNAADVVLPMTGPLFNNIAGGPSTDPLDVGCTHEAGGYDQVFAVKALGAGTLSATLEGPNGALACADILDPTCLDRLIYIRTACADQSSQVSCVNTFDEVPANAATATVLLNDTVYVFVDGYNGDTTFDNGPYAIRFHLAP